MSDVINSKNNNLHALGVDFSTYIHIDKITDNTGITQGAVADGGLTDDLQPTISGYLPEAQGLKIRVFLNGSVVGYSEVGEDGKWSFTLDTPLTPGTGNAFQVSLMDPGNGNSLWLSNEYNFTVTEANQDASGPPAAPVIDSVVDNAVGYKGFTGELKDGDLTNDPQPALSGHADAGSTVNIYDNGKLLGSVTAMDNGTWTFTPDTALADGSHNLTATAANAAGESTATDIFSIVVDATVIKPVIDTIFDNSGSQTGTVADGGLTDDSRPVLTGHAEANSRVDVHVFGPNGKQLYYQSVTAGEDGTWSYQPKAFTTQGTYSFGISSVDKAGNAWSDYGDKYSIQFVGENQDGSTAPDAPVITEVYDDAGVLTGVVANGDKTDDAQVLVSGTAEADSVVTVWVESPAGENYTLGSVATDSDGSWAYQMQGLQGINNIKGDWVFTAKAADAAGNQSSVSTGYTVESVASNQDVPYSSGIEQFGDASNERGYSFTTAQGVEVTSTLSMFQQTAPTGSTNRLGGDTYLYTAFGDQTGEVHVTLPGVAETVTFSGMTEAGDGILNTESVTFYDAGGNVIEVTASTDSNYGRDLGLDLMTATAVNGETIASFTIHEAYFVGAVEWESTTATTQSMMQEAGGIHPANSGDDAVLLSQVVDKSSADITDHQQNTLQLTLNDILTEAHDNLFIQDGKQQLAITGDVGDVVELKVEDMAQDWQDAGQVTAGGVQYEVYQHTGSDVELLVQQGLELQQVS